MIGATIVFLLPLLTGSAALRGGKAVTMLTDSDGTLLCSDCWLLHFTCDSLKLLSHS